VGEAIMLELELELAVELALEETAPLAPEEKAEEEELLMAPVAAWLTVVPLEWVEKVGKGASDEAAPEAASEEAAPEEALP